MGAAAASQVGALSSREVLIAGAIAYWCEGTKNKPHQQRGRDRVSFINSDPGLVQFFLRFLDTAGISRDRHIFRVHIHENSDTAAAERYWQALTGADKTQFRPPTLKRHNPKTVRKNTGEDYRGCLRIDVRSAIDLYRQIEGWAQAAMTPETELCASR